MFITKLRNLLFVAISYLISLHQPIYSNFWSDLAGAVCGYKEILEIWDGKGTIKKLNNCMPLFKTEGRNGCLKQFDLPVDGYYMNYCAQESPSSSYFNPKIQIKLQKCNLIKCVAQTVDLAYNGECDVFIGPYILPTYRFCARLASPPQEKTAKEKKADEEKKASDEKKSSAKKTTKEKKATAKKSEEQKTYSRDADHGYPGYTDDYANNDYKKFKKEHFKYKSLNFEGAWKNDPEHLKQYKKDELTGNDIATGEYYEVPKICAYEDPWMLGTGLDIFDYKPLKQPAHKKSGKMNGFIAFLTLLLKGVSSVGTGIDEALIVDWWAPSQETVEENHGLTVASIGDVLAKFLIFLIELPSNIFIETFIFIGDINRVVLSSLGCVNMPQGPMPPPYPKISSSDSIAFQLVVQQICPKIHNMKDGQPEKKLASTILQRMMETTGCVASELDNNFLHNSVRVGINKVIPTCDVLKSINPKLYDQLRKDNKLNTTDQCVYIKNLPLEVIKLFHLTQYDLIKKCSSTDKSNAACLITNSNLNKLCTTYGGCEKIRVVYGEKLDHDRVATSPNPNLNTALNNPELLEEKQEYSRRICSNENEKTRKNCQTIWGVNIGPFKDIAVEFPKTSWDLLSSYINQYSSAEEKINIGLNNQYTFKATINLDPNSLIETKPYEDRDEKSSSKTTVNSDKICVMAKDDKGDYYALSCLPRPSPLSYPTVSKCDAAIKDGFNCTSTHFTPAMYVKFEYNNGENTYTLAKVIEANTLTPENAKEIIDPNFKLAGYDYSSYVTDNKDLKMPFSGPHSFNMGTSLYGNYIGNANPLKQDSKENDPIYIDGLEYFNGRYIRGGEKICLTSPTKDSCPIDKDQCVLVQYQNGEDIPCANFKKDLIGVYLCPDSDLTGYTLEKKTYGSKEIEIYSNESDRSRCYKYKNGNDYSNEELCALQYPGREIILDKFDPYNNITDIPDECSADSLADKEIALAKKYYDDKDFKKCPSSNSDLPCAELEKFFPDQKTIDFLQAQINNTAFQYISLHTCKKQKEVDDANNFICYKKTNLYDPNKCGVDNKSALENNLCAYVNSITCDAVTEASNSTGYATWPEAQAGQNSIGKCMEDFIPISINSLKRPCVAHFSLRNFTASDKGILQPIRKRYGCKRKPIPEELKKPIPEELKKLIPEEEITISNLLPGDDDNYEILSESTKNLTTYTFVKTFKLKNKSNGAGFFLKINTPNTANFVNMELQFKGIDANYSLINAIEVSNIPKLDNLDPKKSQSIPLDILTKDKSIGILLTLVKQDFEISISYTVKEKI